MRNLLGVILLLSIGATLILLFVSICNYLIAYQMTGEPIKEAIINNVYVKYWVYLLAFFVCTAVVSFIGLLLIRPEEYVGEEIQVFENRGRAQGPVEEYVTVRIKRDDLSKLQE